MNLQVLAPWIELVEINGICIEINSEEADCNEI
jgi:hypothetical protein